MKYRALAACFLVPLSGICKGIKIADQYIQPPGEYEKRKVPFLVSNSGPRVMLPLETLYYGKVFNGDKTIAAINFKGTTDYDGVDLLVKDGSNVYVFQNIWLFISADAVLSKRVPNRPWDKRLQLEVEKIDGRRLICRFKGENTKEPFFAEKSFSVLVNVEDGVVRFVVEKEP